MPQKNDLENFYSSAEAFISSYMLVMYVDDRGVWGEAFH